MSRRLDRIAEFRARAGGGWYDTALRPPGEHQPRDGAAIRNWLLREPTAGSTCFACRSPFTSERRPGAFLTAVASRSPSSGIAVARLCCGTPRSQGHCWLVCRFAWSHRRSIRRFK
jgi:hypothetical protein